jgi:hypothetical protein
MEYITLSIHPYLFIMDSVTLITQECMLFILTCNVKLAHQQPLPTLMPFFSQSYLINVQYV